METEGSIAIILPGALPASFVGQKT
jgi:hypothetical protein